LGKFGCLILDVGIRAIFQCSILPAVWPFWAPYLCDSECLGFGVFWWSDPVDRATRGKWS